MAFRWYFVSTQSAGGFFQSFPDVAVQRKFVSSCNLRRVQLLYILWSVATLKIPPFFKMRAISFKISLFINLRDSCLFLGHGSGNSRNILLKNLEVFSNQILNTLY